VAATIYAKRWALPSTEQRSDPGASEGEAEVEDAIELARTGNPTSFARRPASAVATGDDSRPTVETVLKATLLGSSSLIVRPKWAQLIEGWQPSDALAR
jgi:hypothetical protein